MQVSVETTSELGRKIVVSIPSDDMHQLLEKRIREMDRKNQMRGFRPGKARKYIEQNYAERLKQEVLEETLKTTFEQAILKENLKIAGYPHFDELGKIEDIFAQPNFSYSARVELFPQIQLKPFSELSVEKIVAPVSEEDIEKALSKLRDQYAKWNKVERAVQAGDRIQVNFERILGDKEGGEPEVQEGSFLILNDEGLLPGIMEGLVGKLPSNEPVWIEVTYPDNWAAEEAVAGKKAQLGITILEVAEKEPLDDEAFFKALNHDSDLNALKEKIKERLDRQIADRSFVEAKERVLEQLIKLYHHVALPKVLIDQEMESIHRAHDHGHDHHHDENCDHNHDHDCSAHQTEAVERVLLGLLIHEIVQAKQIQLDAAKVREALWNIARQFGVSPDKIKNQEILGMAQHSVLVDQAVEAVLKEATIIEKPMSFEALMAL